MLVKPQVPDHLIIETIRTRYRLSVCELEFLPIGNDATAWAYRVAGDSADYFLKLRKGSPNRAGLLAPAYLKQSGIENVVAPLTAVSGELHAPLGAYTLLLFPWICGESGWVRELTARQYREWGSTMRAIHETAINRDLAAVLPQENYDVRWLKRLDAVEAAMACGDTEDAIARRMMLAWQGQSAEIDLARRRYLKLTRRFAARSAEAVLCHADIHGANILIDERGEIYIVDWDEVIIAPKERDLMFFIDDGQSAAATASFLSGYGDCAVDAIGLAYYRYDWVMQEFCDNGERVFLNSSLSATDREFAVSEFCRLFAPDDVVACADRANRAIG